MKDELARRLRDEASRLDRATAPVTPTEAMGSHDHVASPSRSVPLLIAAASIGVLIVGVTAFINRGDHSTTDIAPFQPDPHTEPTVSAAPTTTSVAPTTSVGPEPTAPPLDLSALPDEGLAVSNLDGTTDLYDLTGNFLVTTATPEGTNNGRLLLVSGRSNQLELPVHGGALEVPAGCSSAIATPSGRLAICAEDREIHRVDDHGEHTIVMTEPETNPEWTAGLLGRWTRLIATPDGEQLLGQWNGECQAPTTFLLGTGSQAAFQSGSDWWNSPETRAIGWIGEQAIVEVGHGLCGIGFDTAGIYGVSNDGSVPIPLVAFDDEPGQSASWWRLDCNCGNEIEHALAAAIDSFGEGQCCGEPSHGGSGARTGAIYQGEEFAIHADTHDAMLGIYGTGREGGNPDAPITLASFDAARVTGGTHTTFSCNVYTFVVESSDLIGAVGLSEALVPRLGCTTVEPRLVELSRWLADAGGTGDDPAFFRFEGETLATVGEYAGDELFAGDTKDIEPVPFAGGEALLGDIGQELIVFGCGDYTVAVVWTDNSREADTDTLIEGAEDLLSKLPCEFVTPTIG